MTGLELISEYRVKVQSDVVGDRYSALNFALQLPSICGRREYQVSKLDLSLRDKLYRKSKDKYEPRDREIFCYWMHENRYHFIKLFMPYMKFRKVSEWLYDLRCHMTHEGIVRSYDSPVIIVDNGTRDGGLTVGPFLFILLIDFCKMILTNWSVDMIVGSNYLWLILRMPF